MAPQCCKSRIVKGQLSRKIERETRVSGLESCNVKQLESSSYNTQIAWVQLQFV